MGDPKVPDRPATPAPGDAAYEDRVTERVAEIMKTRAVIEQAKGMLSLAYGLNTDRAFELLKQASQRSNRKVHAVATWIVARFPALIRPKLPEGRLYDEILMAMPDVPKPGRRHPS
jgi:ANTAR domain